MKTFVQTISSIAVIAIFALVGFMFGRHLYPKCPPIETRIDTVIVRDTIRDTKLVPVYKYLARTDTVWLQIPGDTVRVEVEVPIERIVYKTEDYKATIEGFRPKLVDMEVYRQTQYITRTETIKVPDRRRWGIGIQTGYGAVLQENVVLRPYIGVGVQYNIISW